MDWLERLMQDIELELAIECAERRISRHSKTGRPVQEPLVEFYGLIKQRSPEQIQRMERDQEEQLKKLLSK